METILVKNKQTIGAYIFLFVAMLTSVLPQVSFAQELGAIQKNLTAFGGLVNTSIIIVVSCAFLFFFYNLARYIFTGGETKESAKKGMMWGIVALLVLTSIWGIIIFLRNVLGIKAGTDNEIKVPGVQFPTSRSSGSSI